VADADKASGQALEEEAWSNGQAEAQVVVEELEEEMVHEIIEE